MKSFYQKTKSFLFTIVAVILMWIVWIIGYYTAKDSQVVPSFSETVRKVGQLLVSSDFWIAASWTILRVIVCYVAALILAFIFCCLSNNCLIFKLIFETIINFFKPLPTAALVLFMLVWVRKFLAPIIVTFFIIFPLCYNQLNAAVNSINPQIISVSKVFGFDRKTKLLKMYIPLGSPYFLRHIGNDFSLCFKVMVSAEAISSTSISIGTLISASKQSLEISKMFALTIFVVVFSFVFELLLNQLIRITYKWNGK